MNFFKGETMNKLYTGAGVVSVSVVVSVLIYVIIVGV